MKTIWKILLGGGGIALLCTLVFGLLFLQAEQNRILEQSLAARQEELSPVEEEAAEKLESKGVVGVSGTKILGAEGKKLYDASFQGEGYYPYTGREPKSTLKFSDRLGTTIPCTLYVWENEPLTKHTSVAFSKHDERSFVDKGYYKTASCAAGQVSVSLSPGVYWVHVSIAGYPDVWEKLYVLWRGGDTPSQVETNGYSTSLVIDPYDTTAWITTNLDLTNPALAQSERKDYGPDSDTSYITEFYQVIVDQIVLTDVPTESQGLYKLSITIGDDTHYILDRPSFDYTSYDSASSTNKYNNKLDPSERIVFGSKESATVMFEWTAATKTGWFNATYMGVGSYIGNLTLYDVEGNKIVDNVFLNKTA